jgi:hypothetical protein
MTCPGHCAGASGFPTPEVEGLIHSAPHLPDTPTSRAGRNRQGITFLQRHRNAHLPPPNLYPPHVDDILLSLFVGDGVHLAP